MIWFDLCFIKRERERDREWNKSHMPTYPIFHCKNCNSSVQLEGTLTKNCFPSFCGSIDSLLFSSELDSDNFPNNCRGQGQFYLSEPSDKFTLPGENHFNFSGCFNGMCCYCALGGGLSLDSFNTMSCYHCMRRFHFVREFSKLKIREENEDHSKKCGWEAYGWAGLSDSLIDLILQFALGKNTKLVGW